MKSISNQVVNKSNPLMKCNSRRRKKALFFIAHPDDAEIGCGGTIAKLIKHNWDVYVFVLTIERKGLVGKLKSFIGIKHERVEEQEQALSELGVPKENLYFINKEDGYLKNYESPKLIRTIRKKIKGLGLNAVKEDNSIVFTHSSTDGHQDHQSVNYIVRSVFRKKDIFQFEIINHTTNEFRPDFFVKIDREIDSKLRSLEKHQSQVNKGRIHFEEIINSNKIYGKFIGCNYAESFSLLIQNPHSRRGCVVDEIFIYSDIYQNYSRCV